MARGPPRLTLAGSLIPRCVSQNVPARNFSQRSRAVLKDTTSLSLLTPDPRKVTPHDLVSRLPILPRRSETTTPFAPVFLVSATFAQWLHGSSSLRQLAINRVFRETVQTPSAHDGDVYAVFAVVDKLPWPISSGGTYGETTSGVDMIPGLQSNGCEGLSLLLENENTLFGSTWKKTARRDVAAGEPEPALIYNTAVYSPDAGGSTSIIEISTRVANTVFTTGQPHTLIATRWGSDKESGQFVLRDTRHLSDFRIRSLSSVSSAYPSVPLHAITRPRKIITGMGNVFSQISTENETQKAIPASSELERILPEYVKEYGLVNERVAVWALIMPSERESNMTMDDKSGLENLSGPITKGGRLHRVTGGGGGWGKKQGLLSLDPEYTYEKDDASSPELPIQQLFEDRTEGENLADPFDGLPRFLWSAKDDAASSLTALAKPGDLVQFFVASLDRAGAATVSRSTTNATRVSSTRVFGVIPATDADSPTVETTTRTPAAEERDCRPKDKVVVLPNHFGALSEKSVTWATFEHDRSRNSSAGTSVDSGGQLSGTKLDIPGSRIVIE